MSDGSIYLRVKRLNQTYFVMCNEDDTVGHLKEQISLATKNETKADHMRIIMPKDKKPLEDDSEKLSKFEELKNESELYVVFQISDDEWEGVHVEDTDAAMGGDAP
mmetsp:Transcript_19359/g.39801  ORF Transcript_19359/g.39801 Transcript_19359/m.39801 type:complete len:106 (+) Transcript_19359:162-479(+)